MGEHLQPLEEQQDRVSTPGWNPTSCRYNKQGIHTCFWGVLVSWRAGKIFLKGKTRGRYYYWNGSKKMKVFRSMKQGMPTHRPRTRR